MNELEKAKRELEDFLNENPEMREKQEKLDEMMSKVPPKQRLDALYIMMMSSATELGSISMELVSEVKNMLEKVNKE